MAKTNFDKASEILNKLYKKYEKHFITGFHDLLWQTFINEVYNRHDHTPYPVPPMHEITELFGPSGDMLVMASAKGGYIPTLCLFKKYVTHTKALSLAAAIAKDMLDQDKTMRDTIIARSITNPIKRRKK